MNLRALAGSTRRVLGPAAAVGVLIALVLAALIAWLNPSLANPRDALVLIGALGAVYTALLSVLGALQRIAARARGRAVTFRDAVALHVAAAFFLVFFAMLEPAHQMASVSPHLSVAGAIDLVLLLAITWAVFRAASIRRVGRVPGLVVAALVIVSGAAGLRLLARVQEPERGRASALADVHATTGAQPAFAPAAAPAPVPAGHGRVLMLAIDGLDWQTLATLVKAGRMPATAALLGQGRYYELDNLKYAYSAPIWSTMYTGVESPASGVYDFVRCRMPGGSGPILQWPRWGSIHTLFLSAEITARTAAFAAWTCTASDSTNLVPPLWSIAAAQGRRTLVVNPLPFEAVPEHLEGGAYVTAGFDRHVAFENRRSRPVGPTFTFSKSRVASLASREAAQRAAAVELMTERRFDLAVYYTHFVDSTQHYRHRAVAESGGDRTPTIQALDASGIAGAYIDMDRSVGELIAAFGPGSVVLVSDHGWTYHGDYEHFVSPMGVLAISPSATRGPHGRASVMEVMPAVLSMLGLDASPPSVIAREFLGPETGLIDPERMNWLRSLGYLW